jgi:hypothetical protein
MGMLFSALIGNSITPSEKSHLIPQTKKSKRLGYKTRNKKEITRLRNIKKYSKGAR